MAITLRVKWFERRTLNILAGVCGAVALGFGTQMYQPERKALVFPPVPTLAEAIIIDAPTTQTHLLDYEISDAQLARYQEIFKAQDAGKFKRADALIAGLEDTTLLGAVQAQRYLHEDYRSTFSELNAWLNLYADHPQAAKIKSLAQRKRPADETMPKVAVNTKSLKGVGVLDGMVGEAIPDGWEKGLNAWQKKDYAKAARIFEEISDRPNLTKWLQSAADFWAYRAYDKLDNDDKAQAHLAAAAQHPFTLYGALAATARDETRHTVFSTPRLTSDVRELPAIKRAAYFAAMNMPSHAEDELRALYPQMGFKQKEQLTVVASALNLPALQLRMSQMLRRYYNASYITSFPVPSWIASYDMVTDPALVYAIARQESAFDMRARNPNSGATGLMQLMPATARFIIKNDRLNEVKLASLDLTAIKPASMSINDLSDPVVNLMVGQHYINHLQKQPYINGNVVQLLAAYNAGPKNLLDWQTRFASVEDPLLFIERIPYRETRQFVKQVLTNYIVYSAIIHDNTDNAHALLEGQWPTVSHPSDWAAFTARQFAFLR